MYDLFFYINVALFVCQWGIKRHTYITYFVIHTGWSDQIRRTLKIEKMHKIMLYYLFFDLYIIIRVWRCHLFKKVLSAPTTGGSLTGNRRFSFARPPMQNYLFFGNLRVIGVVGLPVDKWLDVGLQITVQCRDIRRIISEHPVYVYQYQKLFSDITIVLLLPLCILYYREKKTIKVQIIILSCRSFFL